MSKWPLSGQVALVAGATRGAGRAIAVELARAGFYVYATGRSSRASGPSEMGRPETIEEAGELIAAAGGEGSALVVDHEDPASVAELVAGIERDQGRLDVLVNDIFGGDRYMEWDKPLWEHDWAGGLRMLQMGVHTHLITSRAAIPLMLRTAEALGTRGLLVEMTDGTSQANAEFRRNVGFYCDLPRQGQRRADREGPERRARGQSRDGRRGDSRLAALAEDAGELRRHRGDLAGRLPRASRLRDLRVADVCRPRRCRARPRRRRRALGRHDRQRAPACRRLRRHGHRRQPARLLGLPRRLRLGAGRRPRHR